MWTAGLNPSRICAGQNEDAADDRLVNTRHTGIITIAFGDQWPGTRVLRMGATSSTGGDHHSRYAFSRDYRPLSAVIVVWKLLNPV